MNFIDVAQIVEALQAMAAPMVFATSPCERYEIGGLRNRLGRESE